LAIAWSAAWAQTPGTVFDLEADGVVDPFLARYIARGIRVAEEEGARLVVIRMDTPGGLDSAMRTIVQAILNSSVPVAVFVEPQGARAASAGLFIATSAHVVAMAPGTNIGAAHPVSLGEGEISAAAESKVVNDAVAYIRSLAQERGRNADWVEAAVRQSVSLPATEAVEQGVADLIATDLPELRRALEGRTVLVGGREVALELEGVRVVSYPMTFLETAVHVLADPNLAYVLLTLGTIALIAEFYNPGAIIPGVTGAVALILAFVSLGSLPVNWGGIALIVLAIILFVLDLDTSGFVLSVLGAIAFVLGSLLLFSPFAPAVPSLPRVRVSPWVLVVMTSLVVGFFGLVLSAGVRAQRQRALVGQGVVLGKQGVVESELDPVGVVRVLSETWTAEAEDPPIAAGEKVEVTAVEGLRLRVRRVRETRGQR
jgi:membrane-bound serine protease (ClpP class)